MFNSNSKYKKTAKIASSKYTKEDFKQKNLNNPFDKNIWGPKTWDIMHTFSYNYPAKPDLQTKQNAFNFFSSIGYLLPCSYCQQHCIEYVTYNPPSINSRNELINWVLKFHNTVSENLNKETWTRTRLDRKFETDGAFCS